MSSSTSPRIRMSPETRREQLLQIGVGLLATHPLEEISIELLSEKAGISRGLLYHYFANKQEFHLAIVREGVAQLIEVTEPPQFADPVQQLHASIAAYVDYVRDNYEGYVSLVRSAAGGNDELREVYELARSALTSRIFEAVGDQGPHHQGLTVIDTPATRLLVRGWSAMCEEMVVRWVGDQTICTREELLDHITAALPSLLAQA